MKIGGKKVLIGWI